MHRTWRAAIVASVCLFLASFASVAIAQPDPPARVGRISYVAGVVSYHDGEERRWSPALLNHPFTFGSALWTEPNGRAEWVVAGTRVRLQGSTEIQADALDEEQFRLRLAQGRIDVRSSDIADRPYEILTPRGTVRLMQDGDYVIEAGTTREPTRVGVRSGLAHFVDLTGSVLAVRAGEIGVATGESPFVFTVERRPPGPMPPEWAARDRVIAYRPPQYVATSVTGYEDLDAYGNWTSAGDYGHVWVPRNVPAGWAPYRYGRWVWVRPWGWTWVDDAPWGFAPFHYGRWAQHGGRWVWIPPQRTARPVYAPAVVGFVGGPGAQLSLTIGGRGPAVGWFPLGPREVYVPPYTTNRTYIRNINVTNVYNVTVIDQRLEDVERRADRRDDRRDARRDDRRDRDDRRGGERWTYANQRYATVVPAEAFLRSQPVSRSAVPVQADVLARAEVAPVAAPPAAAPASPPAAPADGRRPDAKAPDPKADGRRPDTRTPDAKTPTPQAAPSPSVIDSSRRTPLGGMPTLGPPERTERPAAPGPAITRAPPPPGTPGVAPAPGTGDKSAAPTSPASPSQPPEGKPGAPADKSAPPPAGVTPRPQEEATRPAPTTKPDLPPLPDRGPAPKSDTKPGLPASPQATPKPDTKPGTPPAPASKPDVPAPPHATPKPDTKPGAPPVPATKPDMPAGRDRGPSQATPKPDTKPVTPPAPGAAPKPDLPPARERGPSPQAIPKADPKPDSKPESGRDTKPDAKPGAPLGPPPGPAPKPPAPPQATTPVPSERVAPPPVSRPEPPPASAAPKPERVTPRPEAPPPQAAPGAKPAPQPQEQRSPPRDDERRKERD